MTRPKPPKMGKPLGLNAAELDQAAAVSTVDTVLARALWFQYAPARFATLLEATPSILGPR